MIFVDTSACYADFISVDENHSNARSDVTLALPAPGLSWVRRRLEDEPAGLGRSGSESESEADGDIEAPWDPAAGVAPLPPGEFVCCVFAEAKTPLETGRPEAVLRIEQLKLCQVNAGAKR